MCFTAVKGGRRCTAPLDETRHLIQRDVHEFEIADTYETGQDVTSLSANGRTGHERKHLRDTYSHMLKREKWCKIREHQELTWSVKDRV